MQKKAVFPSELAYLLGLAALALGTALMEAANFGVSMVVAPAYLFYLKLNPIFPFFSFGMAEYLLQLVLLVLLGVVMKRFRLSYLFSFVTAMIYGTMLDGCMALVGLAGAAGFLPRTLYYVSGLLVCSVGVALLFNTYISPEAYELFVKELSAKTGKPLHRVKTIYDLCSCLVAVLLSFLFFGFGVFEGVKLGTVLCALVNGSAIGLCSRFLTSHFQFSDALKLRSFFEKH